MKKPQQLCNTLIHANGGIRCAEKKPCKWHDKKDVYSFIKDETRGELYRLMDSFLVESKDQEGNERSIERLNKDRHLFIENLQEIISLLQAESYTMGYNIGMNERAVTCEEHIEKAYEKGKRDGRAEEAINCHKHNK